VNLDDRELDLGYGIAQRTRAGRVPRGVDQGGVKAPVVRVVEGVHHLAFNVGVKQLHLQAQTFAVGPDLFVDILQGRGSEDFHLGFAAHVHTGALYHQYLGHTQLPPIGDY
jgi:hypothetical protein